MRNLLANTLVCFALSNSMISGASAGNFDGWCFPADECTGEPMPIAEDTFNTCEEFCIMTNSTRVNRMTGMLYDVICSTDGAAPRTERMFFLRYSKSNSTSGALAISNDGPVELMKCE